MITPETCFHSRKTLINNATSTLRHKRINPLKLEIVYYLKRTFVVDSPLSPSQKIEMDQLDLVGWINFGADLLCKKCIFRDKFKKKLVQLYENGKSRADIVNEYERTHVWIKQSAPSQRGQSSSKNE